jgi:hypothetical protein
MANRVSHFEIHAADPQRAIAFYNASLGWTFNQWGDQPYWLITTGPKEVPGIDGGLLPRHGDGPLEMQAVNAYVCTVMSDSLDATSEAILANGGTVALPKMPVPTVGWLAYFKDTEGNIFGVMQEDSNAK